MFLRISRILIIFSISLFLISCNQKESAIADEVGVNQSHSYEKSKESNRSSSCKLSRLCDDYQKYANQLMRAVESENFQRINSINEDILGWAEDWEREINRNSCTDTEMMNASSRMMSIANSLLSQ